MTKEAETVAYKTAVGESRSWCLEMECIDKKVVSLTFAYVPLFKEKTRCEPSEKTVPGPFDI